VISLFRSYCKYLVRAKILPAERYELVNHHLKRKQHVYLKDFALTINQFQEFCDFQDWPHWIKRNMDYFLCNCLLGGLRWGDFKNLNFEEIDLMQKNVSVFSRKGKKQLNFPIYDFCFNIIRKYNPHDKINHTKHKIFPELNNLNVFNR